MLSAALWSGRVGRPSGGRKAHFDSDLIDLFLARRGHGAVVVAVHLAVAVAGLAGGAGAAGVPQLLLIIPPLVLVLVVQHGLEVHHRPGVPGLHVRHDTQ